MYQLSDIDVKILSFAASKTFVSADELRARFPEIDALPHRLERLSAAQRVQKPEWGMSFSVPNTSYLLKVGSQAAVPSYAITSLGRCALQDYRAAKKQRLRLLWLKNAWIPILVSLVTTLAVSGLQRLWPRIAQWLASIHA